MKLGSTEPDPVRKPRHVSALAILGTGRDLGDHHVSIAEVRIPTQYVTDLLRPR
jgi:hypothetical protein